MIKLSVYHICKLVNDLETDEAEKNTESVKTKTRQKSGFQSHRLTSKPFVGKPSASLWN
jgi:hypothetical protein